MIEAIVIGIGGALGAMARAFVSDFIHRHLNGRLPWHTFIVNIVACFTMGIIVNLAMDETLRLMICTGFLGGFSTLSAMSYEAMSMLEEKRHAAFAVYLLLTYGSCLASCALGFAVCGSL